MPSLKAVVSGALSPLLYANLAAMAAAAWWLSAMGQWQITGIGLFLIVASRYAIPLLLFPAGMFSRYMIFMRQLRRPRGEKIMMLLSLGYIMAFLAFWCAFIFDFVIESAPAENVRLPALLWACVTSVGPLLWWVSQDRGNIFVITLVSMAQIGVLALAALCLVGIKLSFGLSFVALAGLLAFTAGAQALYEKYALTR